MEGSGLKGDVDSCDSDPGRTVVHPGPNRKNQPEDPVLTPLAVEGFVGICGQGQTLARVKETETG